MRKKLHYVFLSAMCFFCFSIYAQNDYWSKSSPETHRLGKKVHRASYPSEFEVFNLDIDRFKSVLSEAPLQESVSTRRAGASLVMEFPTADGTYEKFSVTESSIMEPGLAARYPMIKTYKAIGVDDPTATMRFSVTQFGLHAMSLSGKRSSVYIDPFTENRESYIVYDRVSLGEDLQNFECLVDENINLQSLENDHASNRNDTNDQKLREYRLALSCNGEYAQIFAGTGTVAQQKANVQAQMAITMNRVNEIYERDLAIRLIFVANNDDIIYLNPASDPWVNEFNTTTAQTIDNVIGVFNYDIGHNFNTTGGGSAGCLGCVCSSQSQSDFHKGRGYTGRNDPTGDPFDIDYVAHEMGHQFDGWHTMNTCSRSGNGATEVEPASGSSIMGYAGICPTNVQSNSDAHFNYVSIRDISQNIQTGVSSSCDVETNLVNQPPIADAGDDYTIPANTAFVLRGSASDPDGMESLTYNWSQNDPERAPGTGSPESTWAQGPLYRSVLPSTSPNRYMPQLSDVLSGNLITTWEVTPSVTRSMEFSFIVRDNGSGFAEGIGQTDADLMSVNVNASAGPFAVTSQNTSGLTLEQGAIETFTWDVAGTNANGINTSHVNILLSTDNGLTFDTVLAANTPNDGTETITLPPGLAAPFCRVMIEAVDNIFYAVNSEAFSIGYAITCNTYSSADALGLAIPDGVGPNQGGSALFNTINVPDSQTISQISVSANISHTWIGDLVIQIQHPNGTTFTNVWNRDCNDGDDNINVTFQDGAASIVCATPTTGTYAPAQPLNVFSGLDSSGDWNIAVVDNYNQDTGVLNSWSIEICSTVAGLSTEEFSFSEFSVFPNPNNGSFNVKMKSISSDKIDIEVYDIRGRRVFDNVYNASPDFNETIDLGDVQSGMYLLNMSDGQKTVTKKLIVK
ncbi:reprolysin-like metallopeptidase [Corallibacter sp.]|uniref:reprolysin-like metallopeptidase n=1 Tax=Corallibacter sp. TaxID=2038084 RepID=UPI003AB38826